MDDLAGADPYSGVAAVWLGQQDRQMVAASQVVTFRFGRNIASGDFDGDGVPDLIVGGPDDPDEVDGITGALYARGLGDGSFEVKGNTPEVGLLREKGRIKPVFSLEPFRGLGENARSCWRYVGRCEHYLGSVEVTGQRRFVCGKGTFVVGQWRQFALRGRRP